MNLLRRVPPSCLLVAGCMSCGPSVTGGPPPEPAPTPSAQPAPSAPASAAAAQSPRQTMWRAGGYFCMPRASTDVKFVDADTGCGTKPGDWIEEVCPHCAFHVEPTNTVLERPAHGGDACCYAHQPKLP